MIKYPHISVQLIGNHGNAFAILGRICRELRKHNIPKEEIDSFTKEATSGDYDHLLQICMKTVNVN